ncbi:MAG TPA: RICIN domain-containing protein [Streptosporangiaceae bacterium]|nr:RICIN domain-containing protein [Streptosporangiaceae bacterium]
MTMVTATRRTRRGLGVAGRAVRKTAAAWWLRWPAVVAAVVVALLAPPGAAEAANGLPGNFYANIYNVTNAACVNVRNDSTQAGAWIQEYDCDGTGASDFYFATAGADGLYQIRGEHSNLCITPNGSNPGDGTPLVQWYCVGARSQLWELLPSPAGSYEVYNYATGLCMTFPDDNDWTIMQIQTCDPLHQYQIFDPVNILPA